MLGVGGSTFKARPGVLPALMIGKAHSRNVAVYVTADENLYFAPLKIQLNATLGYPVLHARRINSSSMACMISPCSQAPAGSSC